MDDSVTNITMRLDGSVTREDSNSPVISDDGRHVAFWSWDSGLVPGDTNNGADVFVHDLQTGSTERVSVRSSGAQSNTHSGFLQVSGAEPGRPAISADGRYVSFLSGQGDLVAHDTNNEPDIFLHDRVTGTTSRINVTDDGEQMSASNYARSPAMSGDGAVVAYGSRISGFGLVTERTGFVVELPAPALVVPPSEPLPPVVAIPCSPPPSTMGNAIARIDVACDDDSVSAGTLWLASSLDASDDGRFVAFVSNIATLVPADANRATTDAFLHDRQTGTTEVVGLASDGSQPDADVSSVSISGDARHAAFASTALNLDPSVGSASDGFPVSQVYLRDRTSGATTLVSGRPQGGPGNSDSVGAAISRDGSYVAFASNASDLAPDDSNGYADIYLYSRTTGGLEVVSWRAGGAPANRGSGSPAISDDGRYVTFVSSASNLTDRDYNNSLDVFVWDRVTKGVERVSVGNCGVQADHNSWAPSINGAGRYVAFASEATNLVDDDTNGFDDVFVHDRLAGVTKRVSIRSDGFQPVVGPVTNSNVTPRVSGSPSISADGRFVVFTSAMQDLVDNDNNGHVDVFIHDSLAGTTVMLNPSPAGDAGGDTSMTVVSSDGVTVVFASPADGLTGSSVPNGTHLYAAAAPAPAPAGPAQAVESVARVIPDMERINSPCNQLLSGADGAWLATPSWVNGDGRFVAFSSDQAFLTPNDKNGTVVDAFLFDRETGALELVGLGTDGLVGDQTVSSVSASDDARYVVFMTKSDLIGDGPPAFPQTFLRDRSTGRTVRVSNSVSGGPSNGDQRRVAISADGRFVVFDSDASDLVASDTNGFWDVFLFDRELGNITLLSKRQDGTQGDGRSSAPDISADGGKVTFIGPGNLIPSDVPWGGVYMVDTATGALTMVSKREDGLPEGEVGFLTALSADGRFVAYSSRSQYIVSGDTNFIEDVFVYDTLTDQTERVSVKSDGSQVSLRRLQGQTLQRDPDISGDGRYVVFYSDARDVVPGDTNNKADVFVHDRQTGVTQRMNVIGFGTQAAHQASSPLISADGSTVAFGSVAWNLAPGEPTSLGEVFVAKNPPPLAVTAPPKTHLLEFSPSFHTGPVTDVPVHGTSSGIPARKLGSGGYITSVAVARSGIGTPLVTYREYVRGARVLNCVNFECTDLFLRTRDFDAGLSLFRLKTIIGSDGKPLVSYIVDDRIYLYYCFDLTCGPTSDDPVNRGFLAPGSVTSMAVGLDGLPLFTMQVLGSSGGSPRVAIRHCGSLDCVAPGVLTYLDQGDGVGRFSAVANGSDGFPFVVYSYEMDGMTHLKTVHCTSRTCQQGGFDPPVVLDDVSSVRAAPSLAIGSDGLPIVSYVDETTRTLKVAHCDDVACGSATVRDVKQLSGRAVDPANRDEQTSMAIGIDGLPLVLFPDDPLDTLSVAHCADVACFATDSMVTIDTGIAAPVGSLAITSDGLPAIAYLWNSTTTAGDSEVILAHCETITCAAP